MRSQPRLDAGRLRVVLACLLAGMSFACSSPKSGTGPGGDGSDAGDTGGTGNNSNTGGQGNSNTGSSAGNNTAGDAGPEDVCGDGVRVADSDEECDDGNRDEEDGCSGCKVEVGWACAAMGGGCSPQCGDGMRVGLEACDDGDTDADDGCSQGCELEVGWSCPEAGASCVAARCGDALVIGSEQCDDGADVPGDGCDTSCQLEPGWICVGVSCSAASCGDGIRAGLEQCDDGDNESGDGCVADCSAREPFHVCPVLGGPCTKTTVCGDGTFTPNEDCDDGNNDSLDGCSATCQVEPGSVCSGGRDCSAVCGDGLLRGNEQCDDGKHCIGGTDAGKRCTLPSNCASAKCEPKKADGCDDLCKLEPGFHCPTPGADCKVAKCGNGITEGLEQCDDGSALAPDNELGDGCTPFCTREPSCTNGVCVATCGDGIRADSEACDDGNNQKGDGCSATCVKESGFTCSDVTNDPPTCVDLPLVLRDFKARYIAGGHPDFFVEFSVPVVDPAHTHTGSDVNLVLSTMGHDTNGNGVLDSTENVTVPAGRAKGPVYNAAEKGIDGASAENTHGPLAFNEWYHDGPRAKTVVSKMTLCDQDRDGIYVFDDQTFYPLDGKGWQDPANLLMSEVAEGTADYSDCSAASTCCGMNNGADPDASKFHNFMFTSELRFWFTYKGTEVLNFRGDDDVFVFINGFKAVDLGGIHCAQDGDVVLSSIAAAAGLSVGKVAEVVVYQAERNPRASSYRLELGNFLSKRSDCVSLCGDGIRTPDEACDDGKACKGGTKDAQVCSVAGDCPGGSCVSLNDGAWGHCKADCSARGPHCGDGKKDPQEACDLGSVMNDGSYNGCNPDCSPGPVCGDENVDAFFGEQCDKGAANANDIYGGCTTLCKRGPRCGDGVVQADQGEQCDNQINLDLYEGCAPGCVEAPYCGDGTVQKNAGEQCDEGAANDDAAYDGCSLMCKRASYCGDGYVDASAGEKCDDGNVNDFDGCSHLCERELILL